MTSLELIVRPFQTRAVTPPAAAVGEAQAVEPAKLAIEGSGAKTFRYSFTYSSQGGSASSRWKEIKRTSQTVRVHNPDDPEQYVDIKRPKTITFANEENPRERNHYAFVPSELDEGGEGSDGGGGEGD